MGQQGGDVLTTDNTPIEGKWRWILVVQEAVLSNVVSNLTADDQLNGLTLPVGLGIGGQFNNIDVESGKVIAYYE